jgi:hypothetical protein
MKGFFLAFVWMRSAVLPLEAVVIVHSLATPAAVDVYEDTGGTEVNLIAYYPFDIDGNGAIDYTFIADTANASLRTERANRLVIRQSPPPNHGGPVESLPTGYRISSTLSDSGIGWVSSDLFGEYVSPDELVANIIIQVYNTGYLSISHITRFTERSFIGIEFEAEDGIHYGYFDISPAPYISPKVTVNGWARETQPGVPILAGQVPEPSHVFLASLGMMVFLTKRNRRKLRPLRAE